MSSKKTFAGVLLVALAVISARLFLDCISHTPVPRESMPSAKTLETIAQGVKLPPRSHKRLSKKQQTQIPKPQKNFAGEILDFRITDLSPHANGVRRQRREWLILRDETPFCLTEESDESGAFTATVSPYVANRLLVDCPTSQDLTHFRQQMASEGCEVSETIPALKSSEGTECVRIISKELSLNAVDHLKDILARYAGEWHTCRDYLLEVEEEDVKLSYPNDYYSKQNRYNSCTNFQDYVFGKLKLCEGQDWQGRIGAPLAWTIQEHYLGTMATSIVAVVDTGVNYNHDDLKANVYDLDNTGRDFASEGRPNDPMDVEAGKYHGSHCAGIIAAEGDNEIGIVGIGWQNAKIMAIKVANSNGEMFLSKVLEGLYFSVTNGAHIINCSFGFSPKSEDQIRYFDRVCSLARSNNVIVVCSAGNDGRNNDSDKHYPSNCNMDYANVVAVAASDKNSDELRKKSNYGRARVNISAPGTAIYSTVGEQAYGTKDGTSQAAAVVSGCLSMMKAAFPAESYGELLSRLYSGADRIDVLTNKIAGGRRVNIGTVFQEANRPAAPDVSVSRGVYPDRVKVTWRTTTGKCARVWRTDSETGELERLSDWMEGVTEFVDTDVSVRKTYWYAVEVARVTNYPSPMSKRVSGYADDFSHDWWDPADDQPAGATELVPQNVTQEGREQMTPQHLIGVNDDADWYRIPVAYGQQVEIRSVGADGPLTATLYFGDSSVADATCDDDDFILRHLVTDRQSAGEYLLCVQPRDAVQKSLHYKLRYAVSGGYDLWDRDGADDVPAGATVLDAPTAICRRVEGLSLSACDLVDWFKVELEANVQYVFRAAGASLKVYAEDDFEMPVEDGEGVDCCIFWPLESGTYYLAVRKADESVQTLAYALEYQTAEYDFVFTSEDWWEELPPTAWTANPFLTTNVTGTTPLTVLSTNDEGLVRWAFNEDALTAVEDGRFVTNLVELCTAKGRRILWGHAVYADTLQDTLVDFTTHLPRLPVGEYVVRLTLNRDVNGAISYPETDMTDADNVRELAFRVTDGRTTVHPTANRLTGVTNDESVFEAPSYRPDGLMTITNGLLRFDGVVASAGDQVAAFGAGDGDALECRAWTFADKDGLFTLEIPLKEAGEALSFRAHPACETGTVYSCMQVLPAVFGQSVGTEDAPFVVDAASSDPFAVPTVAGFAATEIHATVTVNGESAGAGDVLAVYDGDRLVGKQILMFREEGTMGTEQGSVVADTTASLQTVCSLCVYLSVGEHALTFGLWDAQHEELYDCVETVVVQSGETVGSDETPIALTVEATGVTPESEEEDGDEQPTFDPPDPAVTHTVTFDLADGADRVGGGALVQSVADGASAVAPEIACRSGYVFNYWNYPTNNVRSDRTITAAYRTGTRSAPVKVDYGWLSSRMGAGAHSVADYEAAALQPTGKRGANGEPLYAWQEYLAGTDPTDANDVFRAEIEMEGGIPKIRWTPDLSTNSVRRLYTIWGKETLEDETWVTPTNAASRFFKVTVDEL